MKNTFVVRVASAVTALVLLVSCSDDGPTTLASGEDVDFVGDDGMAGHTLDVNAEEDDGEVTGELRFSDPSGELVITLECADTDTDGLIILAGTDEVNDDAPGRAALVIREGDPDSATVWFEFPLPEGAVFASSCGEFLDSIPEHELADVEFADVEAGDDIKTG